MTTNLQREEKKNWRLKVAYDAWKINDHAFWHPWWEDLSKTKPVELDFSHTEHLMKNITSFPTPKGYTHNLLEEIL